MSNAGRSVQDATARETYQALQEDPDARLVDVRTKAEWSYVGLPVLPNRGAEPILLEWQSFPTMKVDENFGVMLEALCPDKNTALYFLCRSGARSLAAAREMTGRGYLRCYNVVDGFEGPPDHDGHRSTTAGWKAERLPWRQN